MTETAQVNLRAICPFCNSITQSGRIDGKFYIRPDNGVYICYHCQATGKDSSLLEKLDVIDEIIKKPIDMTVLAKLQDNGPELTAFLKQRGLAANAALAERSEAVLSSLKFSPDQQAIAILVRNRTGDLVGIKYRKIDPDAKPRYLSETGSVNEGFWLLGSDPNKLLIVEGEIDCLSASYSGFNGDILACQTNRLPETALNAIRAYKNIFAIPDKDLGGLELKNSIESLIGANRVTFIELPHVYKDLNEMLQGAGYEQYSEFIRMETRTSVEKDTRSLGQAIPELLAFLDDKRNTVGDATGWRSVDNLLGGGLRSNEMTVINATAKAGKSSFINNLIHNLAKSGKSVALASFEMPPHAIYTSLISIALATNLRDLDSHDRGELLKECYEEYKHLENIVLLQRFGYTSWADIEEWAVHMKKLHNIDYLVLDHAGFLVEKMTDAEENQVLAKQIKKLTNTLGIHIPVVVQAPKTKDGLSLQTSYGGMAWAQNADNFIILERDKEDETLLKVRLEAARYPGSNPSNTPVHLYYKRESLRLTE